jgi:hypothetical protein
MHHTCNAAIGTLDCVACASRAQAVAEKEAQKTRELEERLSLRFRDALFDLWQRAHDDFHVVTPNAAEFAAWSGATKDLLMGFGMRWDSEKDDYTFEVEP